MIIYPDNIVVGVTLFCAGGAPPNCAIEYYFDLSLSDIADVTALDLIKAVEEEGWVYCEDIGVFLCPGCSSLDRLEGAS